MQHLFFDWNPLFENDYSTTSPSSNQLYTRKSPEEVCLFAKLIKQSTKLQVLFLRASNVLEEDLVQIMGVLKPDPLMPNASNKTLKVLDLSYNTQAFGEKGVKAIHEMMETNRTLEYLGLAKNSLANEHAELLLSQVGRIPFPAEQVDGHLAKIKQRDTIVEKNKKLKASKKPEEPVPILDNIEQGTIS